VCVVLFDFPYMTRAASGRRRLPPDRPAVLLAACRAMLGLARSWQVGDEGPTHCVVGGKSMGGRMWSMLVAAGEGPGVAAASISPTRCMPPGVGALARRAPAAGRGAAAVLSGSRDPLARLDLCAMSSRRRARACTSSTAAIILSYSAARLVSSDAWLDVAARFILAAAR
jgi:predicted alpha/beta-hydrolase family hydrolase